MSIDKVDRIVMLVVAALAGAIVANSIKPGVRVVMRQRERVIGGHDATGEPISRVRRLSAPEEAGP